MKWYINNNFDFSILMVTGGGDRGESLMWGTDLVEKRLCSAFIASTNPVWCFSGTNINFLQKLATDFSGSNFWSLFLVSTTIKRHTLENRTIFEENFNGIFLKNPKRHTSTPDPHPNTTSKIVHLGSKTGGKLFPLKIFIENFENLRQIFLKSSSMTKKKKKNPN